MLQCPLPCRRNRSAAPYDPWHMGRLHKLAASTVPLLVPALAASILLTGCFTGERPSFAPEKATVQDPAIAAVLDRLDAAEATQYTAEYRILTKVTGQATPTSADIASGGTTTTAPAGGSTTPAVVTRSSATAISITIGSIRFIDDAGSQKTCDLVAGACQPLLDDATVSNLLVNHDFYAAAPAARLRQDANTMVSAAIASTREIAGQTATCVQVSFVDGSKVYCAFDNGLLAFQDTPDLQIDLVAYTAGSDPAQFSETTVAGG